MAAVTVGTLHPVSPPGYEVNDKGQAAVAITKGQLLIIATTTPNAGFEKVWALATTATTTAHGIALMDAAAGGVVSVGIQGEMDGYTGLTPGAPLFPSGAVAGGIDTTAPTAFATTPAVTASPNVRAVTPTRIRYNFT
jgi:hypothetical protein